MEQSVTHDALVKFAAEKVGVELEPIIEERLFEPVYEPGDTACSSELGCQRIITGYVIKGTKELFDLTSWELLGKGLLAFKNDRQEFLLEFDGCFVPRSDGNFGLGCIILENWDWERSKKLFFQTIPGIPLTFWTAWYELEHRNSVDNATGRSIERTDVST